MPSTESNRDMWGTSYDWSEGGDEWSAAWGGVESEWFSTLWPRVRPFLPAPRMLEIAPGFGRWTEFLLPHCTSYVGVDLAEQCVEACRARYATAAHATFHQNDGRTLPMVEDDSIDFVFTFDSLVHVEMDVLDGYFHEVGRVLAPGGFALIHHSNLGAHARANDLRRRILERVEGHDRTSQLLHQRGVIGWEHWRASSPTAESALRSATSAGLRCVGQEIIGWQARRLIDCITLVSADDGLAHPAPVIRHNPDFAGAARSAAVAAAVFTRT